jgi:predicted nucleic acid-binding protein
MGNALYLEYEEVLARPRTVERAALSPRELEQLLDAFLSVCSWTTIYYGWRPSLPNEADHHLLELAVAGGAKAIVTKNVRDLERGDLRFPDLRIVTPSELASEI